MGRTAIQSKVLKVTRAMRRSLQQEKEFLNQQREVTKALKEFVDELRVFLTKKLTEKNQKGKE